MSETREHRAQELLRALGTSAVPVQERSEGDRQRGVSLMNAAIAAEHERKARRRLWLRGSAIAAAAAIVATLGFASFRVGVGVGQKSASSDVERALLAVGSSHGGVVLQRRGGTAVTQASASTRLSVGDKLETLAGGGAELTTGHSRYRVAESTGVELVDARGNGERLRLEHGKVEVDVTPAKERNVVVVTPHAEVRVVGTAFSVQVSGEAGASHTRVDVVRGTVWILNEGERRAVLHAGDSWTSERVVPAIPVVSDRPEQTAKNVAPTSAGAAASGTLAEENRLFRAALDARNRGDQGGAADLFAELLRRFPRSVMSEEASVGRFRALELAGRKQEASSEARRYLARFPSGHARAEAERSSGSKP